MTKGNASRNRGTKWIRWIARIWSFPIIAYALLMFIGYAWNWATTGVADPHAVEGYPPTEALPPDPYVSEYPGIGHCLALGAIGGNDYHCFRVGSAFVASNSSSDHSRFPPLSDSLSSVDDSNHPWNTIPGVLVAIKKEGNP